MITLIKDTSGEWIGVYQDGKLVAEDHSISGERMLRLLKIPYQSYEVPLDDSLPENLWEVGL